MIVLRAICIWQRYLFVIYGKCELVCICNIDDEGFVDAVVLNLMAEYEGFVDVVVLNLIAEWKLNHQSKAIMP